MAHDWRIHLATTTVTAIPAAFPGGPSHAAGSPLVVASVVTTAGGQQIGFPAPSAVALALGIAVRSALTAAALQEGLRFKDAIGPDGPLLSLETGATGELSDYFEHCFTAVVFSIQALEAYSNYKISHNMNGNWTVKRKGRNRTLSAQETERHTSVDEKLGDVLPQLLQVASPRGRREWSDYVHIRRLRDATVHLKSRHQVTGAAGDFENSPYAWFIEQPAVALPTPAIQMLRYFALDHERAWIDVAAKMLGF